MQQYPTYILNLDPFMPLTAVFQWSKLELILEEAKDRDEEEEVLKNLACSAWFDLSPQGVPGTDGLDYTEEAGGADGDTSRHPIQMKQFYKYCLRSC